MNNAISGSIIDLIEGAKNAFIGDDVKEAKALSKELQVRIFDEYARPNNSFNFTVIVQNNSNVVARDVTIYVRLPNTIKSTKLQPLPVLRPGESERWDLTAKAPGRSGEYNLRVRAIWSKGLYNDFQSTIKVHD